jgi:hypothetical protein
MAVEVAMEHYIFRPTQGDIPEVPDIDEVLAKVDMEIFFPVPYKTNEPQQHFFHNPIHDAESVWWGCIELLFKRRVDCSSLPELQQQYMEMYAGLKNARSRIFPDEPSLGSRQAFLRDSYCHKEIMSRLPPALRDIGANLSAIRHLLASYYTNAESKSTIRSEAYALQEMSRFASLILDTRPYASGMKLTAFPKEWNTQDSPSPGEKNTTQRAGLKRKASEPPDGSRKARRAREESTSEAHIVNAIGTDVPPFPPCTLVA